MATQFWILLGLAALSYGKVIGIDQRVVHGENAKPGEIPYQVSLQSKRHFHVCGGSILNEYYIITAAHCVVDETVDSLIVIAGTIDVREAANEREIQKIIIHENFNSFDSDRNDIALIKVKIPYQKTDLLSFVELSEPSDDVKANDIAVVSGWGRIKQGGASPFFLQRVDIKIAHQHYCSTVYKYLGFDIDESQICAYDPVVMKGSCHGDSGGPLTVNGKLVGLVSWAKACALTDYPTVYTRVSYYIDWIRLHTIN